MIYAIIATLILGAISVLASLPLIKSGNKFISLALAMAAGTLLTDAVVHIFPEVSGMPNWELYVLAGVVLFFGLERFLHVHHQHKQNNKNNSVIIANLVGDGIHNFIDGIAIAAAFSINIQLGIATTLAVFLHEIPQEVGDFAVLIHAGLSKRSAMLFNIICSATSLLGVVVFYSFAEIQDFTNVLLAFSGGAFLYLAFTSLQGIVHPKTKQEGYWQVGLFLLGVGIMLLLKLFE